MRVTECRKGGLMQELLSFIRTRQPVNLFLVAVNILVFIVLSIIGDTQDAWFMAAHGACYTPFVLEYGEYYRVNLFLVAVNILVFIVLSIIGDTQDAWFMAAHGACYTPFVLEYGEYYRLFTCMFLHFGIEHLFYNMLLLIFVGDTLEKTAGKVRYLLIYLIGGLAARFAICLSISSEAWQEIFCLYGQEWIVQSTPCRQVHPEQFLR